MKDIFESEETREAYAKIDLCYFGLEKLNEEVGNLKEKEFIEITIELLEQIVEAKKYIEDDFSEDVEILNIIRALK